MNVGDWELGVTPAGVMRPILPRKLLISANQRLPSGPAVMLKGPLPAFGRENRVMTPTAVILPILLPEYSVNHKLPSGPAVMPMRSLAGVGTENSVSTSAVVIRPILLAKYSVNHNLPSRPFVIPAGPL